jgi:hypothetical protein
MRSISSAKAAFVVTTVIDAKRKEAEDAKHATEAALSEKADALVEVGKERDAKGKALQQAPAATSRTSPWW